METDQPNLDRPMNGFVYGFVVTFVTTIVKFLFFRTLIPLLALLAVFHSATLIVVNRSYQNSWEQAVKNLFKFPAHQFLWGYLAGYIVSSGLLFSVGIYL